MYTSYMYTNEKRFNPRGFFFFIFAFLFTLQLKAQVKDDATDVIPIWSNESLESAQSALHGQWIWMKDSGHVMLARQNLDLDVIPERLLLDISATSQYQLFINGQYIARGPSRCAPHHQSYDRFDITKQVHSGINTVAVRVHFQDGKYSYGMPLRAGLWMQLTDNEHKVFITTDSSWLVRSDPTWDDDESVINRFQMVVNDKVDYRKKITNWYGREFEAEDWSPAMVLRRTLGWPSMQRNEIPGPLTPPWLSLSLRDIPYLTEEWILPEKVGLQKFNSNKIASTSNIPISFATRTNSDIGLASDFGGLDTILQLDASTDSSYLIFYDFGEVHNAYPYLEVKGSRGTQLNILSAPFIIDGQFSAQVVDSDFHDELILSGDQDTWEATYFKPVRYLVIRVRSVIDTLLVKTRLRSIRYPFSGQGRMYSSDAAWVERYINASRKTLEVCTTDAYTDNYRERRQYAQTGYYAALGNYWLFGDHALQRRYLVQTAQEQLANGIMPAYAPLANDDFMVILDSNCLWIRSLRNYLLYSGDYATVTKLLPAATKLMDLLQSFAASDGLLTSPPYAYWLDHAKIDRRGANLTLNGHYLGALEDFADLLEWMDKDPKVTKADASKVRKSARTAFWDPKRRLFSDAFLDGQPTNHFSEHGNAMALAMNIATPDQAISISEKLLEMDTINYITRASGMTMVTPAMSYFLHKGLCQHGYIDESFALFRKRFDKMLSPTTNQTLFEEWWLDHTGRVGKRVPKSRSDAQTESVFPPALFAEYLLGVKPIKPGMREIIVQRQDHTIQQIGGVVPTPQGDLDIAWVFGEERSGQLHLSIPEGVDVLLDRSSFGAILSVLDQKTIDQNESFIRLSSGQHQIQFTNN